MRGIIRYIRYLGTRHPTELGETEITAFLTHLAAERSVARSTQMQALSALLLLYRDVLATPVGDLRRVLRSTSPTRLPAVLSRGEVRAVLGELHGTARLIALLLYGAGLRLLEALDRKAPAWATEFAWQWVFPASRRYRDAASGQERRQHGSVRGDLAIDMPNTIRYHFRG